MFYFLYCSKILTSVFPKHKKTNNISVVSLFGSLVCYLWFVLLAIFGLLLEKPKNILLCLLFPSAFVSKIENPKNICCSSSVL
jgi:hypothetical protein